MWMNECNTSPFSFYYRPSTDSCRISGLSSHPTKSHHLHQMVHKMKERLVDGSFDLPNPNFVPF